MKNKTKQNKIKLEPTPSQCVHSLIILKTPYDYMAPPGSIRLFPPRFKVALWGMELVSTFVLELVYKKQKSNKNHEITPHH